jgi:plasmid maintenance system antidote protein VapI
MAKKSSSDQANSTNYNPNYLLDEIIRKLDLKNDAALSRVLEVAPPVISKIRHNTLPIGATILIRMHEVTHFSIRELREMLAFEASEEQAA